MNDKTPKAAADDSELLNWLESNPQWVRPELIEGASDIREAIRSAKWLSERSGREIGNPRKG